MQTVINLDNPVLKSYLFYVSILVAKMLLMAPLTARWRYSKGVFISSEDTSLKKNSRVGHDDDVERVRRAHLNDMENIPIFLIAGFVYILTNPVPFVAINLFRIFTVCRFIHTYVYAIKVFPQPTRALAWFGAYFITWYMVIMSALRFF